MSSAPFGWPFSSWLDLADLRAAENARKWPPTADAQEECLQFMEDFLHGSIGFSRPAGWSRTTVGLTANWWMGARSRRTYTDPPSGYAISIDAGTWYQLYMTFKRLLAHPSVLPDQAEGHLPELRRRLALPRLTPDQESGTEILFGGDDQDPKLPTDPTRFACLRQLLFYAMQFLFLHELAHIMLGHIDFRVRRAAERKHLPLEEQQRLAASETCLLEYLADAHAAIMGIHLANMGAAILEADQATDAQLGRPLAIEQLRLWGFAAGVVFLVTECFDEALSQPDIHPAASERREFVKFAPAGSPVPFVDLEQYDALNAIYGGIVEAENAWDTLLWNRKVVQIPNMREFLAPIVQLEQAITVPLGMKLT